MASAQNKKKGQQKEQPQTVDNQEIQQLIQQQLQNIKKETLDEQEINQIKQSVTEFQKKIESFVKQDKIDQTRLFESAQARYQNLIEETTKIEEKTFLLNKQISVTKPLKDKNLYEINVMGNIKHNYEQQCRAIQAEIKKIKDNNASIKSEGEQQRAESQQKFQESLLEIRSKIEGQAEEAKQIEKENEELKEQLKAEIAKFEESEKQFRAQLELRESESKEKSQEFLEKIKEISEQVQSQMKLRQEVEILQRQEAEKKVKIVVYDKRIREFNETIEKTHEMLLKFKDQILSLTLRKKTAEDNILSVNEAIQRATQSSLQLTQVTIDLQNEIKQKKAVKESVKTQILEVQNQIKSLKKVDAQ